MDQELLEDGQDYEKTKRLIMDKVGHTLYQKSYSYLDFIYHNITDCTTSK